jgi:hypothetical protein
MGLLPVGFSSVLFGFDSPMMAASSIMCGFERYAGRGDRR